MKNPERIPFSIYTEAREGYNRQATRVDCVAEDIGGRIKMTVAGQTKKLHDHMEITDDMQRVIEKTASSRIAKMNSGEIPGAESIIADGREILFNNL